MLWKIFEGVLCQMYTDKRLCCMLWLGACWPFCFATHRKIFDEDNYAPKSCQDESEYNDLLKEFPFDDSEMTKVLTE